MANNDIVDATNCWWGDPTGPFQVTSNPDGLGNAVSEKVLYKSFAIKPLEANDIGIINILSLTSACDLSGGEKIRVRIKNYGTEEQSGFNLSYQVNKNTVVTENVGSLKIATYFTADFTFATLADLSKPTGQFTINAFTELGTDTISSNDSLAKTIRNLKPDLGQDTVIKICRENTTNLWDLYDTSGYTTKKWTAKKPATAGTGIHTLIVTNSFGCMDTAIARVSAYNLPTPTIAVTQGSTTFCDGASVTLESSPAPRYFWNNGATTRNINVKDSGSYFVITKNDTGCTAKSASTIVVVNKMEKPVIRAIGSLALCPGRSVSLVSSVADLRLG